jgi:hypothetical protein
VAFALALLGAAGLYAAVRSPRLPDGPHSRLAPALETALLTVLTLVALLLSHRHWMHWHGPRWDDYWRYAEILHNLWRFHDAQSVAMANAFLAIYPHSPSPLTPSVIALLMFGFPNALFWLKALNFAATVDALVLVRKLSRRLAPDTPF